MSKLNTLRELSTLRADLKSREKPKATITICGGTGCRASGCDAVVDALHEEIARQGMERDVHIRLTGCHGFCEQGPMMIVEPADVFYCHVRPAHAADIIARTVAKGEIIEELLYFDPLVGDKVRSESDISFYAAQDQVILGQNRRLDPRSIEDYVEHDGYAALASVLQSRQPEEVIEIVKASQLRGRGGGGFLTGRKWESCRRAPGEPKYVICNADEGDPGAYMDRSILEGNPHLVLEGMLIGAFAIGATKGFIYVRNEYPLALENARTAIAQAHETGLLGDNILGTGFSFDVEIARGAGAFVCGESTALMASLEGRVGEPRAKDVHTVEQGLLDKPTNLNNVETWANIPAIITHGAEWFAAKGTGHSRGTKIFALTGRVKNTGLIEVPMGTSLRTIVFDIGGGSANGSKIKAVQTGGPSGGCLPVGMFHLPVDFETLDNAGSMVGSGGMVVMDDTTCMVDVAKYFLKFLQGESCGKCSSCRLGIARMLEIVTAITEGRGKPEHLDLLEELGETVAEASLCGLGKTAPNPMLSTLRYFRKEYEAHIYDRSCPAGVCRKLIHHTIDVDKCNGCGACRKACPSGAIEGERKQPHSINPEVCTQCGICRDVCPSDAVVLQ